MSLRISSLFVCVVLAGCGGPPETVAAGGNGVEMGSGTPAEAPVERIACAIGDAPFADVCTIDRSRDTEGTVVTLRHPDGGFRRLRLADDGTTITAADGAVPAAVVSRGDAGVEVSIGDARYRLPPPR